MRRVGIPRPELRVDDYPFQLSGGMCQRCVIAMAIACNPSMLIADEPTTALDVTTQAQILELMSEMQRELGMAIMLITHDLGVVAEMADHVSVMYLGRVVETADVDTIFHDARHPYTRSLISAIPVPDPHHTPSRQVLQGDVPSPINPPAGCHFHPRCPIAEARCRQQGPALRELGGDHFAACHVALSDPG